MAKINETREEDKIEVLESDLVAVRKLPDVYIGALGNAGFINMVREIVQNFLDPISKRYTLNKHGVVSYDERNHTVIVEDYGPGIELDKLVAVYSKLHSSSNYNKKEGSGNYSSGKNGMGGTITNYLSKFFIAESYRADGTAAKVEFEEGILNKKGLQTIKCPKGRTGMTVTFAPSDMMGPITVTKDEIGQLIWNIIHLCLIGTTVTYNTIDLSGRASTIILVNNGGIQELLDNICESSTFNPIGFMNDNGTMKVDILFTYDTSNMDEPKILGFANMCPTAAGKHIDAFLDAIVKYFRNYMNKIYLANNKKLTVNRQDILTGLRVVISAFHLYPLFTGKLCPSS